MGQAAAASYIVSNLCFDPATMRRWIRQVRARGVTLPMYVGLAGPVERTRLLRMAAKAGASESARFLAGHVEWFLRFGRQAATGRSACSPGWAPPSPRQPPGSRGCTFSRSTRSSRPNSGAKTSWLASTATGRPRTHDRPSGPCRRFARAARTPLRMSSFKSLVVIARNTIACTIPSLGVSFLFSFRDLKSACITGVRFG